MGLSRWRGPALAAWGRIQLVFASVKKLHPWVKAHHRRRARWQMTSRNRFSRRARARAAAIAALQVEFHGLPQPNISRAGKWIILDAPANFSLRHNYNEVVGFLWRFREEIAKVHHLKDAHHDRHTSMRINFTTIENLAPAAALVLAAEIDRWRRFFSFRPIPNDIENWNPEVRTRLIELGLFGLLDVAQEYWPAEGPPVTNHNKMIKFLSETGAPGASCLQLKTQLEAVAGEVPARTYFYDGVSEAMANVGHHAYPPRLANAAVPWMEGRWWATGSYRPKDGSFRVIFYDQGVGIPATLSIKVAKDEQQQSLLSWIKSELLRLKSNSSDHGKLIQAALMFPRSSTGESNRGNGLGDIRGYVENSRAGTLRILSGRGEIAYERGGAMETKNHAARFTGTLIEWEVFRDLDANPA